MLFEPEVSLQYGMLREPNILNIAHLKAHIDSLEEQGIAGSIWYEWTALHTEILRKVNAHLIFL